MYVGIDTDFLIRISMTDHPGHPSALLLRDQHLDAGNRFALTHQVIHEFIHVATDTRRFKRPLTMKNALEFAKMWCEAEDLQILAPCTGSLERFFTEMKRHQLGRKRILDTSLAVTLLESGITHLMTGNPRDYRNFEELELIEM